MSEKGNRCLFLHCFSDETVQPELNVIGVSVGNKKYHAGDCLEEFTRLSCPVITVPGNLDQGISSRGSMTIASLISSPR